MDITDANHPARIFITEAESHVGAGGHAWVQSMTSIGSRAWCAATVCAVAKACGYDGICMPGSNYLAAGFGQEVVQTYGGTRIDGPMRGNPDAIPQTGDLVVYQHSGDGEWEGYHIGMVRYYDSGTVYTVEGNTTGSTYSLREKTATGSNIGWYARPDWTKIDSSAISTSTGSDTGGATISSVGSGGDLYTTRSTRADASIREVCYLDNDGKPSIKSTGVKLSVINYTNLLADFVKVFGGVSTESESGSPDNIDALPSVPRTIVEYLTSKGLNTAAAIGIIGNIRAESNFDTSCVGDNGTSFGICQWHLSRGTKMKQMAGVNDWDTNLTGQLDYLWFELRSSSYSELLTYLQEVPNTLEGAKTAADKFVRLFEIPDKVEEETIKRQAYAEEYWNMVIVVTTSDAGATGDVASAQGTITNQSGQTISTGTTIAVPSSISQTGIIANYTNYNRNWASNTIQRKLYDLWIAEGKPSSHYIATLQGYYLIAMASKFATTGDIVSIVLEDGTYFNAILGDAKGSDAGSEWGHNFSGSYDIVEWEANGSDQSALRSGLSEAGWLNKKVDRVINYGQWLTGSIT